MGVLSHMDVRANSYLIKCATKPTPTPLTPHGRDQLKARVASIIASSLGLGGALGIGLRSIFGWDRQFGDDPFAHGTQFGAATIRPVEPARLPKPRRRRRRRRRSEAKVASIKQAGKDPGEDLGLVAKGLYSLMRTPADKPSWFHGDYASTAMGHPWLVPATVLGVPLAAYAGYKGTDYILDKYRRWVKNRKLRSAEREYRQLLAEAAQNRGLTKKAGDPLWPIRAFLPGPVYDALSGLTPGALATLATVLTVPPAVAAYKITRKRTLPEYLREAVRYRQSKPLATERPVYLIPEREPDEPRD